MISPRINDLPDIGQVLEPMLIQAAIPELTVERFYKGILCRLSWLDEMQPYPVSLAPMEHRLTRHLRSIVHDNAFGQAKALGQSIEVRGRPLTRY
jgi:hypothetical protein